MPRIMRILRKYKRYWWVYLIGLGSLAYAGFEIYEKQVTCSPSCINHLYWQVPATLIWLAITIVGPIHDQQSSYKKEIRQLENILSKSLDAATEEIFKSEFLQFVRANIMLIDNFNRLSIRFTSSNWEPNSAERKLRWNKGVGVAGVAWETAEMRPESDRWTAVYAPEIQQLDVKSLWGLSPSHAELTKNIVWVISTPLVREMEVVGVFNYDAISGIQEEIVKILGEHAANDGFDGLLNAIKDEYDTFAKIDAKCRAQSQAFVQILLNHDML